MTALTWILLGVIAGLVSVCHYQWTLMWRIIWAGRSVGVGPVVDAVDRVFRKRSLLPLALYAAAWLIWGR